MPFKKHLYLAGHQAEGLTYLLAGGLEQLEAEQRTLALQPNLLPLHISSELTALANYHTDLRLQHRGRKHFSAPPSLCSPSIAPFSYISFLAENRRKFWRSGFL